MVRVRKLKETLVMVQQLDKNMSNLRTWLSRIEGELSKPVVYSICHGDEIHRKLAEQQVTSTNPPDSDLDQMCKLQKKPELNQCPQSVIAQCPKYSIEWSCL